MRTALEVAHANITAYHQAQRHPDAEHQNGGIVVRELQRPVDRAACYVPSALAPLVSTVLMTAVPAKVAGVAEVVLVTSPRPDGTVAPGILAAAAIAGVDEVYRVGGPAVIGALAYGTESIRPVDVIVGPGSARVAQAKREVASAGLVGVPSAFAGPSEVVVVADASTPVGLGRHRRRAPGRARSRTAWPGSITWDEAVADAVTAAVAEIVPRSPRREHLEATLAEGGYAVLCDGPEHAIEIANAIAPEHLELLVERSRRAAPAGAPRRRGVLRAVRAGLGGRLPRRSQPRPAHLRLRSLLGRAAGGRLPEARPRRVGRPGRAAGGGRARDRARHLRGPRRPRRVDPPAAGRPGMTISPRDDLALMEGYHSPQVEVAVRLNTNEAPEPPPAGLLGRARRGDGHARVAPLPRPLLHARCARPSPPTTASTRPRCSRPTARTRCSRRSASPTAARAARSAVFEPTYALHSHIARVTGTGVATGRAHRRPRPRPRRGPPGARRGRRRRSPSCARRTTPPACSRTRRRCATVLDLAPGLLVVDEAYGQFAPWSALELVDDDRPLVVTRTYSKTWSMAAARLGYLIGPRALVAQLDQVVLPYHLDAVKQAAGRIALEFDDAMRSRVAALVEERGRLVARLCRAAGHGVAVGGQLRAVPTRATATAPTVWQALLDQSVLVRDCSSWPRLDGCLRVTIGTPTEDDAFLAALEDALA